MSPKGEPLSQICDEGFPCLRVTVSFSPEYALQRFCA
jgi:hypothetical protein